MRGWRNVVAIVCAASTLGLVWAPSGSNAAGLTILRHFQGAAAKDGSTPTTGVVFGPDGTLYGTTQVGGNDTNCGTVFQMKPRQGSQSWRYKVIYRFKGGQKGCGPQGGLAVGPDGTVYGTTAVDNNTVFQLTPPAEGETKWTHKVLHSFQGAPNDGSNPATRLLLHSDGGLYGTTTAGGASGAGTIFRMRPPTAPGRRWRFALLHSFTDGNGEGSDLAAAPNGDLYGTTVFGGTHGYGTVFRLRRARIFGVIHSFNPEGDGDYGPAGPPAVAPNGALYATAHRGGIHGGGTILKRGRSQGFLPLHSFDGSPGSGRRPYGSLILAPNGMLYGLVAELGSADDSSAFAIYRMKTTGNGYVVVHAFENDETYTHIINGTLTLGPDGAIYGAARQGGQNSFGYVFRFEP